MRSDEELRKTYSIETLDQNTVKITFFETATEPSENGRQARLLVDEIIALAQKNKDVHYNFLIDLTRTATVHFISDEAKKAYISLSSYTNFKKAAIVGKSLFLEVTINLILQAVGRGNSFKMFDNEADARAWMQKD